MPRSTTDRLRSLADRHAPLVRPERRGAAGGLAVLAASVTAVLAWRYAGDTGAGRTDRSLAGLVDMQDGLARLVGQAFAAIGGPVPVALALLLLAPLAWALRGPRGLALVVVGPPTAMVTTSLVLKPLVVRTRGETLAFPSGHTTSVASLATACAVLLLGLVAVPRVLRLLAVAGLAAVVVVVGASLVGRGYHYPTDTLGAVGVAVAVVLVAALVVDAWADLVADPGPDPRLLDPGAGPADPRERPTDVLPRVPGCQPRARASSRASSSEAAAGSEPGSG
ncbi:phosphatase PAP2 family protein [Actinomycetospora cinnamomea]|uniref:Undecaprenyl-diphosphatase n=1 Tax=Actinomycetospora cinnamomea TaxID=663609 RepID=A0A2U1F722_9PSEU|nr:phosphatase PAP2 family protein [Actinomycetospora cinnamomea]PVZ07976.1 undecaprenyl-diphosphatase [Actinomycetospora cinnamomea]